MAWMPGADSPGPAGVAAFQVSPSPDVHTTTSRSPAVAPNVPVTVKPPPAAAAALTCAVPAGTGSNTSVQLRPPSAERAAYGTGPAAVRATPVATTVRPAAATCCSVAAIAPAGSGRSVRRQFRPSGVVHTAGCVPSAPTATKPSEAAATPSICRSAPLMVPALSVPPFAPVPPATPGPPARCQPVSPADHHA